VTVTAVYGPANTIGSTINVSVKIVYPTGIPYSSVSQITVGSSAQRTITH
jgi:hypothetical protein